MKVFKYAIIFGILVALAGLFFTWSQIEFKTVNGLSHWSGFLILIISSVSLFMFVKGMNKIFTFLLLLSLPILTTIQFIYFAPILNISSVDLSFSSSTVQAGFFITLIGGTLSLLLFLLQNYKERVNSN